MEFRTRDEMVDEIKNLSHQILSASEDFINGLETPEIFRSSRLGMDTWTCHWMFWNEYPSEEGNGSEVGKTGVFVAIDVDIFPDYINNSFSDGLVLGRLWTAEDGGRFVSIPAWTINLEGDDLEDVAREIVTTVDHYLSNSIEPVLHQYDDLLESQSDLIAHLEELTSEFREIYLAKEARPVS